MAIQLDFTLRELYIIQDALFNLPGMQDYVNGEQFDYYNVLARVNNSILKLRQHVDE